MPNRLKGQLQWATQLLKQCHCHRMTTFPLVTLFYVYLSVSMNPSKTSNPGQKFRILPWNMPKVNLWLKKHELNWNKICENDNFTVPSRFYSQIHHKRTNIFISSHKKNDWAIKRPNPNSSHIMQIIGFEYVMPSPRK